MVHRIRISPSHQISYAFLGWRQIVADRLFCKLLLSFATLSPKLICMYMSSPFTPGSHIHSFQFWRSVSCCLPEVVGRRCAQQVAGHLPNQTQWEWGSWEQVASCQLRPELRGTLLFLCCWGKPWLWLAALLFGWKGISLEQWEEEGCVLSLDILAALAAASVRHMFDIGGGAAASLGWSSILKCQLKREDDILLLLAAVLGEVARTL